MFWRAAKLVITVAALSAVAAGCSPGAGGRPQASGGGDGTPAAQLTGVQLRAALLPPSDFPPGYGVQGEQDSGSSLAGSGTGVDLATEGCADFVSHSLVAMLGATAYAGEGIRSRDQGVEYAQVVWQFASPAGAAGAYRDVRALADRCPDTTLTSGGVAEQVTIQAQAQAPVGRQGAVEVDETITAPGATATVKTLWSAAGTDLFDVEVVASAQLVPAPESPSLRTLMGDLIASVLATQ
jgi:hypothetical protein